MTEKKTPSAYIEAIDLMTDYALVTEYRRTNGEPGNPEANALLAEIERRNLDI